MTPLQEAAQAAKDKLALPVCKVCGGYGKDPVVHVAPCRECSGCGVDTSDPDALTGRAVRWLAQRGRIPQLSTDEVTCRQNADWSHEAYEESEINEQYRMTPEAVAAACLRLVARCSA